MEWDIPAAPEWTLSARAIHTGSQYVNSANTQQIPSWTRYDLGARYTAKLWGQGLVVRANLENVFDKVTGQVQRWLRDSGRAAHIQTVRRH